MTALQVKAEASAGMRRGAHRTTGRGRLFPSSPSGGMFFLGGRLLDYGRTLCHTAGNSARPVPFSPGVSMARKNDKRFLQANREALFALAAYALYFLWWYLTAYGLGSDAPENYRYTLGMPDWFFYSCVLGYPVACLLVWGLVRFFFKDMPLGSDENPQAPERSSAGESRPGREEHP